MPPVLPSLLPPPHDSYFWTLVEKSTWSFPLHALSPPTFATLKKFLTKMKKVKINQVGKQINHTAKSRTRLFKRNTNVNEYRTSQISWTLTSRWICPCRWRYSKALRVSFRIDPIADSSKPSGYAIFMRCRHDPSAMNGMTTQRLWSTTNEQYALIKLGWSIKLIVWASLRMSSCKRKYLLITNPNWAYLHSFILKVNTILLL